MYYTTTTTSDREVSDETTTPLFIATTTTEKVVMEDAMRWPVCRYCWEIQIIQYERIQIIQYEYNEENKKCKYKLNNMHTKRRGMTNEIEE